MFFILERTISMEERIRRAEEIYNRRRTGSGIRVAGNSVNRAKKEKVSLFKKMILQLAICAMIYIIFYLIKHGNYIFSEEVINKTKEFLSYDINFGNLQNQISVFINSNKDKLWNENIDTNEANSQTNTVEEEATNKETENKIEETNTVGGIGGAATNEVVEDESEKKEEKKSQAELDIEYVKENYSFIIPVKGTVTSRYGKREATEVVSANHAGIDIGADTGTAIYAAMDGTVTVSSSEGEYGKHIDIENGEILTRYAHCSKLLVKEGQKVKQGDKIAEVGSTGNSTGPHLHFEIRRENRTINPEKIIKFD